MVDHDFGFVEIFVGRRHVASLTIRGDMPVAEIYLADGHLTVPKRTFSRLVGEAAQGLKDWYPNYFGPALEETKCDVSVRPGGFGKITFQSSENPLVVPLADLLATLSIRTSW